MCVVGAIAHQAEVLASKAPDEERLKALKYVVHFVADVRQPLHAGFADDRGGNQYQVQAFGRGTNRHALWDSALIQQRPGGEAGLRAAVQAEIASANPSGTAGAWAAESCRLVSRPGFYPDGNKIEAGYAEQWTRTLAQRLATASRRLARELNEATLGRE
jgi:hypothetical protein